MTKGRRSVLGNIAAAPSAKRPVGVMRAIARALEEVSTPTPDPMACRPVRRAEHRPQDPRVRHRWDRELRWRPQLRSPLSGAAGNGYSRRRHHPRDGPGAARMVAAGDGRARHRTMERQRTGREGHRCGAASHLGAGTGSHQSVGEDGVGAGNPLSPDRIASASSRQKGHIR